MGRLNVIQHRFTSGEFDPKLLGRSDTEFYYSASERALNVFITPQGGFRRRPGLEYIDRLHRRVSRLTAGVTISVPNGGTGANANDNDTTTNVTTTSNISTTNPYVVVQYDLGSSKALAFADVVGAKLSAAGSSSEFFIQVSNDNATWTSLGQAVGMSDVDNTQRRRIRGSWRYVRFARIGATDLSTLKAVVQEFSVWEELSAQSNTRILDFVFNLTEAYCLAITEGNIAVYRNGEFKTDVRATAIALSMIPALNWTQSADTMILVQEDMRPQLLKRQASDTNWSFDPASFTYIPRYDFVPATAFPATTLTPSAISGTVTLTSGVTSFAAQHIGQYVEGNGGRARIVQVNTSTTAVAVVEVPFYNTNAIASGNWAMLTGFENVWSIARGWPRSVTFHEGRLWFGGSKTRPQTLWGSRVGLFFDFDPGTVLDDDGIDVTLDTDQANAITNMVSNRTLQILTIGGEFIARQATDEPITPLNINIQRQSLSGSEENLRCVIIEGSTIFVQRKGRSILQFNYNVDDGYFTTNNLSLISSHLVREPSDLALRSSASTDEASVLMVVNSDGSMTVACLLLQQKVVAFTDIQTAGDFRNCAAVVDEMYFVVRRTINGETVQYLERFNDNCFTDAAKLVVSGLPASTFGSLSHLEGQECRVRADGSVMANRTPASGSVTIERDAETSFEIGLNFNSLLRTIYPEDERMGPGLGQRRRIAEAAMRLYQTKGFKVNGRAVVFRGFGPAGAGSPLDQSPPLFSGDKVIRGLLGWKRRPQVEIMQDDPVEMNVLAMTVTVGF
jgi:hypothetical protein